MSQTTHMLSSTTFDFGFNTDSHRISSSTTSTTSSVASISSRHGHTPSSPTQKYSLFPSSTYNKHNSLSSITRNSSALPPSTSSTMSMSSHAGGAGSEFELDIDVEAKSRCRVRWTEDLALRYAPGNNGYFCRRSKSSRRSSRDGGDVRYALSRGLIKKSSK